MPYVARRGEDGFYSIKDVPVFAEVAKGVKDAPFNIGQQWMQDAVAHSKLRAKEGYLAPLHFEHHGGREMSFKAGHYKLTRVGKVKIGGKTKFAIFADFEKVPGHVFDAILANEWPYRSVEIASYAEREIESIALLDDDTPFHKFELLNGGTIEVQEDGFVQTQAAGALAFAKTDKGLTAALFHFGGEKQMRVNLKFNKRKKCFVATDDDGKALDGDMKDAHFEVDLASADFKKKLEDDDNLPKEEAELKKMAKAIDAKLKKLGKKTKLEDGEKEEDGEGRKPAEVDDKGMKAHADVAVLARFDSMQREIDNLKKDGDERDERDQERDDKIERDEEVDETVQELKDDGYHVSDETVAAFHVYAKAGSTILKQNVKDYRRLTRRDGPDELSDDGKSYSGNDELVGKYAAQGEEAQREAAKSSVMFAKMVDAGMKNSNEREAFVGRDMVHKGFESAVKKAV